MNISKIDKNFKVDSTIEREGLVFYDADEAPFQIYGVYREGDHYVRMPEAIANRISEGVATLNLHTAGGRVRFVTDSPYLALQVELNTAFRLPHCAFTGTIGLDVYSGTRYMGTFVPPDIKVDMYESVIDFPDSTEREITINLPSYSGVNHIYIGIKDGSVLKTAPGYDMEKPIVYYGSSITQGGCASRPGNTYQSIISREHNWDFINLGFSGSALAEDEMAAYISQLDMVAFVYDYDYNSPSVEHYRDTHERMFRVIREKNPDLPILMMSRPQYYLTQDERKRMEVMFNTYYRALEAGDNKVYCLKGEDLLIDVLRESALVDNVHPTDCGFASMAYVVGKKLEEMELKHVRSDSNFVI